MISNVLLFKTTYCGEWWFLALYIELLLLSLLIPRNTSKMKDVAIFLVLFSLALASQYIYYNFGNLSVHLWNIAQYMVTFFTGALFAKFRTFEKTGDILESKSSLLIVGIAICTMYFRGYSSIIAINNILFAPIMVLCVSLMIKRNKAIRTFLLFFGAISTEIWLSHSFFIYYGFYKMAYISTNPWIVLIWVIVLSVTTAIILKLTYMLAHNCVAKAKNFHILCINR